jgi:transposase-like protein
MSRLPTFTQEMDLPTLIESYGSEEKCRAYLEAIRWPDGLRCPRCQSAKISRIAKRGQFDCDSCRYQFSVTAGTIFHDSHLPLWKWFLAVYVVGESKKGISANQLKRMLHVSYKTAWYMCHRIRAAMRDDMAELLTGIVEADEAYFGGRGSNSPFGRKPSPAGKATVLGVVEREGRVRVRVSQHRGIHAQPSKEEIWDFLTRAVSDDAEAIYTDGAPQYVGFEDENTRHESVNHGTGQWVQADVHTNTIESVWSLFKRSVVGSYHHLSVKHLPAYLDEMAFRYNNRDNAYLFRDTLLRLIDAGSIKYAELIAEPA